MHTQLHVAIDVGSQLHRVAIGWSEGDPIEELDCAHTAFGLSDFFNRIRKHEESRHAEVCVAMEGYGGYARPLDSQRHVLSVNFIDINMPHCAWKKKTRENKQGRHFTKGASKLYACTVREWR